MQSADDAIIRAWTDEILSNPNAYVLARVGEVDSKPKFGLFDERLKHPQIQSDMILIAAHAIADATTWIAFLPTTDEKIDTLNRLIKYYKRLKKSTWKNEQEDMDDKIKKITAIDIFILMWKDLRSRLRPSLVDRMTQSVASKLTMPKFSMPTASMHSMPKFSMPKFSMPKFSMPKFSMPKFSNSNGHHHHPDDDSLGGSKRRKSKKSKKSRRTMNKRKIRRTRKSHV
jgi:hypothetical protein